MRPFIVIYGFGILMILFGLYLLALVLVDNQRIRNLDVSGQAADATVKQLTAVDDFYTTYYVMFTYSPTNASDASTITVQQEVIEDFLDTLRAGQIIQVRYLPDDPTFARILGHEYRPDWFWGVGGIVLGLLFIAMPFTWRRRGNKTTISGDSIGTQTRPLDS